MVDSSRISIDRSENSVCFGTVDEDLFEFNALPEIRSIDTLRKVCAKRAKQHADKAIRLRNFHFVLSTLLILSNTASAVIAGINSRHEDIYASASVTVLSSLAASLASINVLFQPASRKREHLESEHRYKSLGRDLSVKLAIYDKNQVVSTDCYWAGILRDTQRTLDSIQSSEPEI